MWEKGARADHVKQKNAIIANSGIKVAHDLSLLHSNAGRSLSKWNTMLKLVSYFK
jgi:hypothetical protein